MNPYAAPPIEWGAPAGELEDVFSATPCELPPGLLADLEASGTEMSTAPEALAAAARDWWPLALHWALEGRAPRRPGVVARPATREQVVSILRAANASGAPVTASGGRSGVCGGAVPVFGGIALDCCGLSGVGEVDPASLLVTVAAGTIGRELEAELSSIHGLTIGHRPQSIDLATVGGWVACRGAGQYSTRYGKIEDIVAGLEVVLADGRVVRTGALQGCGPRSATGPDLTQLFVGSEGTLGIVTAACLRAHPLPQHEERQAWAFPSLVAGLEALRRTLRAGASPAVLRLYDEREAARSFDRDGGNVLIALDEGDEAFVGPTMEVLERESGAAGGERLEASLVARWLEERNDVSALAPAVRAGIVVDTIEVAARWADLAGLYDDAIEALTAIEGLLVASAHVSHAYLEGACLYFTFAGRGEAAPDPARARTAFYKSSWQAVMAAARRHRGSISHHHGIGIIRGGFLPDALGEGFGVLESLKSALDPKGILNPGKLGLASPFGAPVTLEAL